MKRKKYKYYAQHMHMHSCYQPGASMEGHMYHAAKLGMKYIWLTDHDIRIGRKKDQIDCFDFEQNELFSAEESGRAQGFKLIERGQGTVISADIPDECFKAELTKETCFKGTQCLKISACSEGEEWKGGGVYFWSSGKRHCGSLMAGIKLEIAARLDDLEDCRVIFDVRLSQRPPEHECAHLLYVIGSTEGLGNHAHTAIIPLTPANGWQMYTMNLSEDVVQKNVLEHEVGGLDNAFDTLSIIVESRRGTATTYFDEFRIHVKEKWEPVRDVQKRIAREKGEQYGICPFVGTEISMAGMHKNCFSTTVPLIPYDEYDYKVSHEDAVAWVKKYGGIFALNHPFEEYKGKDLDDNEKEDCLIRRTEEFIKHEAWGATLMEVGFPLGRNQFSLEMHLRLWDKLTEAGIFLTGYGSSDNHSNQSGWYSGNNFANWLGVEEDKTEPIGEESFVEAMQKGRIYMGNPVALKGAVCFETEDGLPMGSVIQIDSVEQWQTIHFSCDQAKPGWRFRMIYNGELFSEETVYSGNYRFTDKVKPQKGINYVRAELYDENNMCIMLTNPIYIVQKGVITNRR